MARICPLYSSSKGNCIYISCAEGGILIDAGVSAKKIREALSAIDVDISTIQGILITHEHSDHISGLRVFASSHHIPVYASPGTLKYLEDNCCANQGKYEAYEIENEMFLAGMYITPFPTLHDTCDSVGYALQLPDGRKISVATDLGCITEEILAAVRGSDLILLESNHDVRMLQAGSYPYYLKQRILSDHGHLSNESCSSVLPGLAATGTTRFILGHLSQENNLPQLAFETAKASLEAAGACMGSDYLLSVAAPADNLLTRL